MQAGGQLEVLDPGQAREDPAGVGHVAGGRARRVAPAGLPVDQVRARSRLDGPRQDLQRRRLAAAVGPEQGEHASGRHGEGDVLHDDVRTVGAADAAHVEHAPTVRSPCRDGSSTPRRGRARLRSTIVDMLLDGLPAHDAERLRRVACIARASAVVPLDGGITNRNYRVRSLGRRLRRPPVRPGVVRSRDRPGERVPQLGVRGAVGCGTGCPGLPPGAGVLVVRGSRAGPSTRTTWPIRPTCRGSRTCAASCTRARPSSTRSTCSTSRRATSTLVRDRGFRLPPRYGEFEGHVSRMRAAMRVDPGAARAVQQRPPGGQHHRRRLPAVAHRLRVLGEQRGQLRAREHLERVHAAAGGARRPRHRPTGGGRTPPRSPGPASGR